jgi:hypothetical protein
MRQITNAELFWLCFGWIALLQVVSRVIRWYRYRRYSLRRDPISANTLKEALLWIVANGTVAALLALFQVGAPDIALKMGHIFGWVMQRLGVRFTHILVAVFVTALGTGAYLFKARNQKWYGMVEVGVGFLSALFVAGTLQPNHLDLAKWATLAGSAYVIARGLENRAKGREVIERRTT